MEPLTALLTAYQIPSVFAGAFFFGDSVILTAAYVAGQLSWSPIPLFLAALLGTVLSDTLWFLFGAKLLSRFNDAKFLKKEREKMSGFVQRLVGERPLPALIMVKFLYGSRVAMILFVASRGMSFTTFSFFNAIGSIIWLLVFIPLGYFAGKGVGTAFPYVSVVPAALAVLVLSIIAFRVITIWMERRNA
ncbi:VTT domain-containing protein [bacterium]|nr:VTT domain-containing protein [bacterium]